MEIFTEKILVVDHQINIRKLLATRLTLLGYKVVLASNGKDALINFINESPDLVIIDIMLPKLDGYSVCRRIRENSQIPIIILTAVNSFSDRVIGLELGADDYLVKPFLPKELEARIRSVLRRNNLQTQKFPNQKYKNLQIGNLFIDSSKRLILKDNSIVNLTKIEYSLLELFLENLGTELSRIFILENVWGYTPERQIDTRIVDVHISRLRLKIEEDVKKPYLILTVRGIGYKFQKY